MQLTDAEQVYADKIIEDLTSGSPDGTHEEWIHAELERVLYLCDKGNERKDAIEDTTVMDLIVRTAESAAIRASQAGLISDPF